ncbi:tubulin alpha chain isoform X2 [Anabrus simplex]|uniref:tubulin alpha chain isoform X2 n=1 Tax=Anabrus simplex TaxID=316456 RepID=UPI0034DD424D
MRLDPAKLLRVGTCRNLYDDRFLLTGKEDAANNYARGRYTLGMEMIKQALDKIRMLAEGCGNVMGFMIFNSLGGGTGSGFNALLLQELAHWYSKKPRLEVAVFPAPRVSSAIVEPYNAVLNTHDTLQHVDCTFLVDNEALRRISGHLGVDVPQHYNLNQLVSQMVSSITASMRFDGAINVDLADYQTNLVPYPRIHFPLTSLAPIISSRKKNIGGTPSVEQITEACFTPASRLVVCDPTKGKYMACCLLYRGDVVPKDVNAAICAIKQRQQVRFVNWCATGFKVGINYQPPSVHPDSDFDATPRAATMIFNTTAISDAIHRLNRQFGLMFSKKAFVHWYVSEGMEEAEFLDAREDVLSLEMDYKQVASDSNEAIKPHEF